MILRLRYFKVFKRYHLIILILLVLFVCAIKIPLKTKYSTTVPTLQDIQISNNQSIALLNLENKRLAEDLFRNSELRTQLLKKRVEKLAMKVKNRSYISSGKPISTPIYNVHVFYYGWYGNPVFDGAYKHWNHKYIPNWQKQDARKYPSGFHKPPEDIGSNFYPLLGCYSSRDSFVIDTHVKEIRNAGIGVIIVSWNPPNFVDSPELMLPLLFEAALKYNVKVSLHVEPYPDRNPINLKDHLKHFLALYGSHKALYKIKRTPKGKELPVFYIYDSYLIPDIAWKELLGYKGNLTIRGTHLDGIYLGLLVEMKHKLHIKKSQFDGFYTYFATNSFTYGSTWKNWRSLSKYSSQNGLIFVPSVGPGYIDSEVRPWNNANVRHRRHGQYYDVAWRSALNSKVNYVSITSFNEWHEGTQIEPAVSIFGMNYRYLDYDPEGSYYYLNLTKTWVEEFQRISKE